MEKIGKYQTIRVIGRGATSAVYLAHDPFNDREVAIKVVNPEIFSDPQYGRRYQKLFLNEASLAGKLSHPHIVTIYDAVADDTGGYYIAMEYVPGGTLERYAQASDLLPVAKVVEIVFKCSRALDYAYRHGVIHRDLKPANILLAEDGGIKISDFGASLKMQADTTQVSGIGSPAYMSPEQMRDGALTHQSDIFSLGVVLYQLVTGTLPFKGSNNYSVAYQVLHVDPPAPSVLRAELPPVLDQVVLRALAKEQAARYQTWDEFAQDLLATVHQLGPLPQDVPEMEKFDALKRLSFFAPFNDVELWEVVRFTKWSRHPESQELIREGDAGRSFFVLAAGRVRIIREGNRLRSLEAGSCFGEMAYLAKTPLPRSATVIAEEPVTLIEIEPQALAQASEACRDAFNRAFLETLSERLAAANTQVLNVLNQRGIL
jgi:serine/threonine protein kinase